MKCAESAYEEGDISASVILLYSAASYGIRAILILHGIYTREEPMSYLNLIPWDTILDEREMIEILSTIIEIKQKGEIATVIEESSLKYPSLLIRNVEAKDLMEKGEKLIQTLQRYFDEFHN
ncbi:hypothetical protein HS7_16380 [Sulfolobales archaeon HS-7]|nr:hypothetical protein HS7_16380 [Sulfolobales archaeon HS-7]